MSKMSKLEDKTVEELKDFASQEKQVVPPELEHVMKEIAKTGRYRYPWEFLKPLITLELKLAMEHFLEHFPPKKGGQPDSEMVKELQNLKEEILNTLGGFTNAPFTIQRLTELIIQPRKHYKTCAKFYRGVLKNILVVSTVDPEDEDEQPAKRIKLDVNGESSAIVNSNSMDKTKIISSPVPDDKDQMDFKELSCRDVISTPVIDENVSKNSCYDEHVSNVHNGDHENKEVPDPTINQKQEIIKSDNEKKKEETKETNAENTVKKEDEDLKDTSQKEESQITDEHIDKSSQESSSALSQEKTDTAQTLDDQSSISEGQPDEPMDQS